MPNLYCDSISAQPIDMDWSQGGPGSERGEFDESWESWETAECEECGAVLVLNAGQGNERHREYDGGKCLGHVSSADGPMMNYAYPLPHSKDRDPEELARAIKDLPLCVVKLPDSENYHLALTGGGMDLSWEICEAYIRCGYYPPTHYADLPRICGRGESPQDRSTLARCRDSFRISRRWASNALNNLRHNFPAKRKAVAS